MSRQPAVATALPSWLTWWQRPFPDANTLLLPGRRPTLVDTDFVGHADETAAWARAHAGTLDLVVNTPVASSIAEDSVCRPVSESVGDQQARGCRAEMTAPE